MTAPASPCCRHALGPCRRRRWSWACPARSRSTSPGCAARKVNTHLSKVNKHLSKVNKHLSKVNTHLHVRRHVARGQLVLSRQPRATHLGGGYKSIAELMYPEANRLNFSIHQSGVVFKCPYSNRPLKPGFCRRGFINIVKQQQGVRFGLGYRTYQLHRPLPFMHRLLGARSTPRCAALRSRPLSLERRLRRLGRRRRHAAVRVRSDELAGVAARLPHAVVEHGRRLVRRRSLGFALPALRGALPDLPAVQATKKSREHRDFRVGRALAGAVTRRPPIFPRHGSTRTEGYAYDVGVWDLSIVQGPLSVAPCQPLTFRSQLLHRCTGGADMPVAMQPVSSIACVSRRVSLSGRGEAGAHRWAWSGLKRGADMPMAMQSVSSISSCPPAQPASTSVG
jgi:hypothetical protein